MTNSKLNGSVDVSSVLVTIDWLEDIFVEAAAQSYGKKSMWNLDSLKQTFASCRKSIEEAVRNQ